MTCGGCDLPLLDDDNAEARPFVDRLHHIGRRHRVVVLDGEAVRRPWIPRPEFRGAPRDLLRLRLVHGQRRGEHAGMRIGNAEIFEDALDRAILAERTVQRVEGDVGLEFGKHRSRYHGRHPRVTRSRPSHSSASAQRIFPRKEPQAAQKKIPYQDRPHLATSFPVIPSPAQASHPPRSRADLFSLSFSTTPQIRRSTSDDTLPPPDGKTPGLAVGFRKLKDPKHFRRRSES